MFARLKAWWRDLGYCWNQVKGPYRTFGIRPFGKRFYWFVIDDSDTAVSTSTDACEPFMACHTHGRCWTHSDDADGEWGHLPERFRTPPKDDAS